MAQKTNVLVTGSGGYIARQLIPLLDKPNIELFGLDNWSNSLFVPGDLTCDIRDKAALEKAFHYRPFDVVVHLAAVTDIHGSEKDILTTNVEGTQNVIHCMMKTGVEKIVFASSAAVYGEPSAYPLLDSSPVCPTSNYGMSKYVAEWAINGHFFTHKMSAVNLRIFNPIGGDTPKGSSIMSQILQHVRNGEALIVYGSGEQSRDFLHAYDVARAMKYAIDWVTTNHGILTCNICSGKETTINDLLEMFTAETDHLVAPKYLPEREGDVFSVFGDRTTAGDELGWSPTHGIEEAIRSAYEKTT